MSDELVSQPPATSAPQHGDIPPKFQKILEDIKKATHFYDCPPQDFDPLNFGGDDELNAQLRDLGLPPKPDQNKFPVRYRFWKKMFSGKLVKSDDGTFTRAPIEWIAAKSGFGYEEVEPELDSDAPAVLTLPSFSLTLVPPPRRMGKGIAGYDASVNWCGAYVAAHDGRKITEIHGSWTVPRVDLPDGVDISGLEQNEELRCSTWLGLDGQRGYLDASLPQIGTSHFVKKRGKGRVPRHGVWCQWWLRDVENPPPIKLPLQVRAGHEIMASLFVVDSTHVNFLIANHTTGQVCTPFKQEEPSSYLAKDLPGRPLSVSGATGEWITERPVNWTTGKLDTLPFFDTVEFEDCHVVLAFAPTKGEVEEQLLGTLLINATDTDDDPPRKVKVAHAERGKRGSFSTKFVGKPTSLAGGILSADAASASSSASSSEVSRR